MNNPHYDNQRIFCEQNNVPFFAHSKCNQQTLSEMLVERYGDEEAFIISSSTHITSCPVCSRSWCD
jgi:hypothetical protein